MMLTGKRMIWLYGILVAGLFALIAYAMTLDEADRLAMLAEEGWVETSSALLHFVCFAYVLIKGKFDFLKKYPYFVLFPLLFGMRELDFQKRFTEISIYKISYYLGPAMSWQAKVIGGLITLKIAVLGLWMIKRHYRQFWQGLKNRSVIAYGALVTISLACMARGVEKGKDLLGFAHESAVYIFAEAAEEIWELGFPIAMILTFAYYFHSRAQAGVDGEN